MNTAYEILQHIIKNRRSIYPKSYLEKVIPEEVIKAILESANYAPTHKITEPWRFVIIQGEAKEKLGQELAIRYQELTSPENFLEKKQASFITKTSQAACIIAICIQYHPEKLPAWEEVAAVAAAVQNMALTATSLAVGAYWSSPTLINHLDGFLGLGENEKCLGLFYMGYHENQPTEAKRTSIEGKVRWMKQ